MRPNQILSFVGFIAIVAGTYCPLLRPFHLFNWDIYVLNKPYGIVVFVVALVGLAAVIVNQSKLIKAMAWLSLVLVILLYIAAVMKVQTTFSFIPFKGISSGLSHLIKFKWGWWVLFAGAILAVLGSFGKTKNTIVYKDIPA